METCNVIWTTLNSKELCNVHQVARCKCNEQLCTRYLHKRGSIQFICTTIGVYKSVLPWEHFGFWTLHFAHCDVVCTTWPLLPLLLSQHLKEVFFDNKSLFKKKVKIKSEENKFLEAAAGMWEGEEGGAWTPGVHASNVRLTCCQLILKCLLS